MRSYFKIQWQLIGRHLQEMFGLPWYWGHTITAIVFVVFSFLVLSNYQYAEYIYFLLPIFFMSRLANRERQQFLKMCFGSSICHKIRVLENIVISFPFTIALLLFQHYFIFLLLLASTFPLAYVQSRLKFRFVLPTPFQKRPFEFIVGFRNTFYVVFILFGLSVVAAVANNLYLGLFALICGFLISMSYFSKAEDSFWVWSHIEKPNRFLLNKIKTAMFLHSLLYLPIIIILSYFFYENILQILIVYGIGNVSILFAIVMKYASFPRHIGLKEAIIIGVCIYFVPLLIVVVPFFYFQSLRNLSRILK